MLSHSTWKRLLPILGNGSLSLIIYAVVIERYPEGVIQTIRLGQFFALTAFIFLYLSIALEPIFYVLRKPFDSTFSYIRKLAIISTFFFSLIHASLTFFKQLDGFEGLGFLSEKYLLTVILGFTTLCMLFFFSLVSLNKILPVLKPFRFVVISRLIYIAGILTLIHALMLGTHFSNISSLIPQILFAAMTFLFIIESLRLDDLLQKKFIHLPRFGISSTLIIGFAVSSYFYALVPSNVRLPGSIHAEHIKLAENTQLRLQQDTTKRYTLDVDFPATINSGKDVKLSFKVFDASSGNQVMLFNKISGKTVHLIVVDSSLTYFNHIHPEYENGVFTVTTQFPKDGSYHLYADFQPFGAIEQYIASTVSVGKSDSVEVSPHSPDTNLTKVFDTYEVSLDIPSAAKSSELSVGKQLLSFTLKDAQTKQPITNLKPYLEAFGHLVMINQKTFEYIHVHPNDLTIPAANTDGGPMVAFMPLGIYGPIKPGIYRLFAQFNPNNHLFTADYTINIK